MLVARNLKKTLMLRCFLQHFIHVSAPRLQSLYYETWLLAKYLYVCVSKQPEKEGMFPKMLSLSSPPSQWLTCFAMFSVLYLCEFNVVCSLRVTISKETPHIKFSFLLSFHTEIFSLFTALLIWFYLLHDLIRGRGWRRWRRRRWLRWGRWMKVDKEEEWEEGALTCEHLEIKPVKTQCRKEIKI